jgi:hypothetical protein
MPVKTKQKLFEKTDKKPRTFFNPKTNPDPDRKPSFEQQDDPDPDRCQKVNPAGL